MTILPKAVTRKFQLGLENGILPYVGTQIVPGGWDNPMYLLPYIPVLILLGFLLYEFLQLLIQRSFSIDFSIRGRGIVFFPEHHLWMAIYASHSLEGIQLNEINQLRYLQIFSIEVNPTESFIKLILYAKSYDKIIKRINSTSAILETVLPGIEPEPDDVLTQYLSESKFCKIGRTYFLMEGETFLIPQYETGNEEETRHQTSTVLVCNVDPIEPSEANQGIMDNVQVYFLSKYPVSSFFEYLGRIAFNPYMEGERKIWNPQELIKIRLRYFVEGKPKTSFEGGIQRIKTELMTSSELTLDIPVHQVELSSKVSLHSEKRSQNHRQMSEDLQNELNSSIPAEIRILSTEKMNQICTEVCNLPKSSEMTLNDKIKRCQRRSKFCLKLVHSHNFFSILESIFEQRHETEQIYLITELKRELSYQQLLCIFAQLTQLPSSRVTYAQIISLILLLFKLQFNDQINRNGHINTTSEMISLGAPPRKEESPPLG